MIELARQRADSEQVANVTVYQARHHSFTIAISRHGAMFFRDAPNRVHQHRAGKTSSCGA